MAKFTEEEIKKITEIVNAAGLVVVLISEIPDSSIIKACFRKEMMLFNHEQYFVAVGRLEEFAKNSKQKTGVLTPELFPSTDRGSPDTVDTSHGKPCIAVIRY